MDYSNGPATRGNPIAIRFFLIAHYADKHLDSYLYGHSQIVGRVGDEGWRGSVDIVQTTAYATSDKDPVERALSLEVAVDFLANYQRGRFDMEARGTKVCRTFDEAVAHALEVVEANKGIYK